MKEFKRNILKYQEVAVKFTLVVYFCTWFIIEA